MLCGSGAYVVLQEFADVIAIPIPEIEPMFGFDQYNPHHDRDIWNHTISVINSIAADPILRWAAFLHDIGKPLCFTMSDDGIGHFMVMLSRAPLLQSVSYCDFVSTMQVRNR